MRGIKFKKHFKVGKHLQKNLVAFIRHQSFKKLVNFVLAEYERVLRKSYLHSFPYLLVMDVTNVCNLRCPFCPTNNRQGREKGFMSLSLFKEAIDTLKDYVYLVNLFNWGEPLLHPQIYEMIKYANQNNIFTVVSSNFNCSFDEESAKQMIESGLEYLYVAIDGISQETYSKYRGGGDFNTVISNVSILLKVREKMRASNPFIEWRYLVFRHNEFGIETAKKMAKNLGIDKISFEGGSTEDMGDRKGLDRENWLPADTRYRRTYLSEQTKCDWLWRNLVINVNGAVSACCWSFKPEDDFGRFNKTNFHSVWNNEKFLSARRTFKNRSIKESGTLCDACVKTKKWYRTI